MEKVGELLRLQKEAREFHRSEKRHREAFYDLIKDLDKEYIFWGIFTADYKLLGLYSTPEKGLEELKKVGRKQIALSSRPVFGGRLKTVHLAAIKTIEPYSNWLERLDQPLEKLVEEEPEEKRAKN